MFFETTRFAHEEQVEQLSRVTLRWDSQWNDDGHRTKFAATFHAADGSEFPLGDVKILQRETPTTRPPSTFEELDTDFVSLGQSRDYYDALDRLGKVGRQILHALQDVTLPPTDPSILKLFGAAVDVSLLRFPEANMLYRQAAGITVSGKLEFGHRYKFKWFSGPHEISFTFDSDAPLGRIVALVGENASGKTSVLGRLAMALCGLTAASELRPMRPDISLRTSRASRFRKIPRASLVAWRSTGRRLG